MTTEKLKELVDFMFTFMYPICDIFNTNGIDFGEWHNFENIKFKVVYRYGYIDILGLTSEEFEEVKTLMDKYYKDRQSH